MMNDPGSCRVYWRSWRISFCTKICEIWVIRTRFFGEGLLRKSPCELRKRDHKKCGVRLDLGSEMLVFWPLSQCKTSVSAMNHLLDFPDKKCNLGLAVLNIFGGCAMLGLCTYV